ncbi:acyl-CoA thioesterase II [Mycobacterium heckeshornense]|nr:acyl-CoA thioesterase II [Mycobacterium heckeshornense]
MTSTGRMGDETTCVASSLVQRLQLEPAGRDRFVGKAPPAPPRIYGGELAAQALAAANATVEKDRVAHVLQCTYLAPGNPAQRLEHSVVRVRDGRSFSTRTVQVHNDNRAVLTAAVGYHVAEEGLTHQLSMPRAPLPAELPTIRDAQGTAWTRWAEQDPDIEMRVVAPNVADPVGRRKFWCRIVTDCGDDPRLQTALAAYLSDFTMVASIRLPHEPATTKQYLMSTLSHVLYFHRRIRACDWHLMDHHSPVAAGGRGLALLHAYNIDGELVMTAVQEGLIRPLPPDYE